MTNRKMSEATWSRQLVVAISLVLGLMLASDAFAQNTRRGLTGKDRPTRPPLVQSVDLVGQTVTIQNQTYRVSSTSRILDAEGNRISLSRIRGRSSSFYGDMVDFEADRNVSPVEIRVLQLLPPLEP